MKLELCHLAPYLPYKLDFITQSGKVFKSETKDCFEIRILKGNSPNGNKQYHSLTLGKINRGEFKPILRPLSDLTKEINIEGYGEITPINFFENECDDDFFGDTDFKEYIEMWILTPNIEYSKIKYLPNGIVACC